MSDTEATLPADPRAYLDQVMAEIAEEVRARRASGDLPPKLERELDELFLAHSPVAGRGGDLGEALRMVDAATFIDPVVPVESERAAGAVVKKGMRSLMLWYVGWVTHQMSQSAAAVSRALHIVDDRLQKLERQVEVQRVPTAGVVEFPMLHGPEGLVGRARCGRGGDGAAAASSTPPAGTAGWSGASWRPAAMPTASIPAPRSSTGPSSARSTCAEEPVAEHLRAVAPAGLGAVVLSGIVEGMAGGERAQLLERNRQPARPGRDPRDPFGEPGGLGCRRRAAGGRPRAGPPTAPRGLVPALGAGRVRGHEGPARPGRCRLPRDRGPRQHRHAVRACRAVSAAAGGPVAVHQFIPTLNPHDATGTHTLLLRGALRAAGWRSEIFAEAIHDDLAALARKHWTYPEHAAEGDVAIYQFTTSSAVAPYLAEQGLPVILDFHNFTGPEFFDGWEPRSVQRAARAADELGLLAPRAVLGLAKSRFSEQELRRRAAGAPPSCPSWPTTAA